MLFGMQRTRWLPGRMSEPLSLSVLLRPLALVGITLGLIACTAKTTAIDEPPPLVGVVTATPTDVPLTRTVVGRLSAFRSADVNARVAGVLLKRAYVEGTQVRKGQLLFQIDPAPLQAALDATLAQLARDEANLAQARANLERYARLRQKQLIAEQAYADQQFLVQQTEASVKADEAAVESARINLGYASVRAPIDGRAGEQQVTEGALVGQGTATHLATISQVDPLYVNFTIAASDLQQLQAASVRGDIRLATPHHTTVTVTLPDESNYEHSGTVDFSAPTVDPATGSVGLRAVLPNPEFRLLPGSYVTLHLTLGERHAVVLVPQAAVQRDVTGAYVLIVDPSGTVVKRNVATAGMHGTDWIISSGLKADDAVIVSGIQAVQVGVTARSEPWSAPAETATDGDVAGGH